MIELWKSFIHAFLHDENAVKRWVRGGLNGTAMVAVQVLADPMWSSWSSKQWMVKLVPAVVAFAAGSVTAPGNRP